MTTNQIKVSAIVPMYNVDEYVQETIESLLSQTLSEIEIILIDDQSTDKTYEIAADFDSRYDQIVLYRQDVNQGVSAARNIGLKLAKGQYVFFVDADDTIPSNTLAFMYQTAIDKNVDLVTGIYERFDSKSSTVVNFFNQFPEMKLEGYKNIYDDPQFLYSVYSCGKLFSKKLIYDIKFPEHINFAEDQVFTIHALLKATRFYNVSSNVYNYRLREHETESASQSIYKDPVRNFCDLITALDTVECFIGKHTEQNDIKSKLLSTYLTRLIHWNIWTALSNALLSTKISNRLEILRIYMEWIKGLKSELILSNLSDFKLINIKLNKFIRVMDNKTVDKIHDILDLFEGKGV